MVFALEICKFCIEYYSGTLSNNYCTLCSGFLINPSFVTRRLRSFFRKNNITTFNLGIATSYRTPSTVEKLIKKRLINSLPVESIDIQGPQILLNLRTECISIEYPTSYYYLEFSKYSSATQKEVEDLFYSLFERWINRKNLSIIFQLRLSSNELIYTKEPLFLSIRINKISDSFFDKTIGRLNKFGLIKIHFWKMSSKDEYIAFNNSKKRTLWVIESQDDLIYGEKILTNSYLVDSLELKNRLNNSDKRIIISREFTLAGVKKVYNNPLWSSRNFLL